jgi:UDP-N-acetylmuramoylalanine--D-glutamate ligase
MTRMNDPLADHTTVAILGLGSSGQAACRLLHTLGKRVIAVDGGAPRALALPDAVEVRWGSHAIEDATAAVLSPSLNPEWPENQAKADLASLWARAAAGDLALWPEVALAAAAFARPVLTIGGTDGKSTTAAMAHALLSAADPARAWLGGNSWQALSDVVLEGTDAECGVIEVSAFQLWAGHPMAPAVSLLTNIADDHLDHYADVAAYVAAKQHIHANLDGTSLAVVCADDARLVGFATTLIARGVPVAAYGATRPSSSVAWSAVAYVDGASIVVEDALGHASIASSSLVVPGAHNRLNAAGAWLASRALAARVGRTVDAATATRALGGFHGLPHRLAYVRTLDGVRYYDDSKATNAHAAATGLRSLEGPLVAIVGGVDKRLPLGPMIDALSERARHVIAIGEVAERFVREATPHLRSIERSATLGAAVVRAQACAARGDAVVLSPGCSSFDQFRSFEDRGQQYVAAVQKLESLA